jgi:Ca-activated chloride channel homolog
MTSVTLAAVAVAGAVAIVSPQSQQPQVFRARQDLVRLDILVADKNKPITGLTAADFTVLDDGVPQQIDFVSYDELPLNVVLNLDASGSIAGQRLQDLRAAGQAVLDQLRKDDRAALLSFSETVSLHTELTTDWSRLRNALNESQSSGQTSLVDASLAGLVVASSSSGRSLMLTFSDGLDTSSLLPPESVLDSARRTEVVVFGVSDGKLRAPFLKDLANATGGDIVEIRSTSELKTTFLRLLSEYRQRYLVAYTPSGVETGGWHTIAVKVSKKGATVKTRQGYQR